MELRDSPPSLSILEESDFVQAMMGMFNNLVMFDQHVQQNSRASIVPDLATGLVMERGRNATDIPVARGRQMARWQPYVKGMTVMVDTSCNGWRMEDGWLDR
jgi:hypothetical protein